MSEIMPVTNYDTVNGVTFAENLGGNQKNYMLDALGNVTGYTDQHGTVISRYWYKPSGGLLSALTASDPTLMFCGAWGYRATGRGVATHDVKNRAYDDSSSTWTTLDPYAGSRWRFQYARGNPANWADPAGMPPLPVSLLLRGDRPSILMLPYERYSLGHPRFRPVGPVTEQWDHPYRNERFLFFFRRQIAPEPRALTAEESEVVDQAIQMIENYGYGEVASSLRRLKLLGYIKIDSGLEPASGSPDPGGLGFVNGETDPGGAGSIRLNPLILPLANVSVRSDQQNVDWALAKMWLASVLVHEGFHRMHHGVQWGGSHNLIHYTQEKEAWSFQYFFLSDVLSGWPQVYDQKKSPFFYGWSEGLKEQVDRCYETLTDKDGDYKMLPTDVKRVPW